MIQRMIPSEITRLQGQSVLVKSATETGDPKIARRGTIETKAGANGPEVTIVLEFPDMNNRAAHRGIIPLDAAAVERLVVTERNGVYEHTINGPFDPNPESLAG